MSNVLYIRGDVPSVINKLETVRDILVERELKGYSMFREEFTWVYESSHDGRVCPFCRGFDGDEFTGSQLKSTFPNARYLGNYIAHPLTHTKPELPPYIQDRQGSEPQVIQGCGCKLRLLHPAESFEHILHKEKAGAIQ